MRENPLGVWLNTIIKPKYGAHPQVREIERVLQQMLTAGQMLLRQYQRGQLEESRTGLEQTDGYAEQIVALPQKMEQAA